MKLKIFTVRIPSDKWREFKRRFYNEYPPNSLFDPSDNLMVQQALWSFGRANSKSPAKKEAA